MTTESTVDNAISLLGAFVMDDGSLFGDIAYPFQLDCAQAVLDPSAPPNRWESRPRGGSKTSDAAAIALAALVAVLPNGAEAYCIAADKDQARLLLNDVRGFVQRTPVLASFVEVNNDRVTTRGGSFLQVLAADGPSTWGLKPSLVIADELSAWKSTANSEEVWHAITTAMGKVPNARLLVISMAGSPHHWSHDVYMHAQESPRWSFGEVLGPLAWTDPAFLEEQQQALPESIFQRLFMNRWVSGESSLASRAQLDACCVLSGPQGYDPRCNYLLTLDVGLVADATCVMCTHTEDESLEGGGSVRRVVLDQLRTWHGSHDSPVQLGEVEEYIVTLSKEFGHARLLYDPHQAAGTAQNLRSRGVIADPFLFTTSSVGRLGLGLSQAIRNQRLAIWHDAGLIKELLSVQLKETGPGQFRLTHSNSGHDDMAVTLAMAVVTQLEALNGSVAKRWLESLSPIHQCGQPNLREALTCSKCREQLTPPEPEPEYVPEPVAAAAAGPWSPWDAGQVTAPNPQHEALMRLVQDNQSEPGWRDFAFRRRY